MVDETIIPPDEEIDETDDDPDAEPDATGGIEDTPEPADEDPVEEVGDD